MMAPVLVRLLENAWKHVSLKDITEFCPNDPEYPGYVQTFQQILSQRLLPSTWDFDIVETISLTLYHNASVESHNTDRFRRFRIFVNTVAVAMGATSESGPSEELPPNYLLIRLIEDAHYLDDNELLGLLGPVAREYLHRVKDDVWVAEDVPFLHLAQLILALLGGDHGADIERLAQEVMESASRQTPRGKDFLWACTGFDQLHDRWRFFINLTFEPYRSNAMISSLRDALL